MFYPSGAWPEVATRPAAATLDTDLDLLPLTTNS